MSDLTTKILVQIRDKIGSVDEKIGSVDRGLHRLREEHGQRLTAVEQQGKAMGLTLKQILGAVEYGNKQRDTRVGELESRVHRIEQHLDLPPALE